MNENLIQKYLEGTITLEEKDYLLDQSLKLINDLLYLSREKKKLLGDIKNEYERERNMGQDN